MRWDNASAPMPYCTAKTVDLNWSRIALCVALVALAGAAPACLANAR